MRAVDPRLLQHARTARSRLVVAVMLGLSVTGLILAQAALLGHALAAAALGTGPTALAGTLVLLSGVAIARGAAAYGGEVAALRGALTAVLLRFCDLTSGAALLDGHDLASYAADDVRSLIGGCPQDPHLFEATIRDNLSQARPDASDEELEAAAARARLLPWIKSLPCGWATPVGTGGAALSGGERQRLALRHAGGPYQRMWENEYEPAC